MRSDKWSLFTTEQWAKTKSKLWWIADQYIDDKPPEPRTVMGDCVWTEYVQSSCCLAVNVTIQCMLFDLAQQAQCGMWFAKHKEGFIKDSCDYIPLFHSFSLWMWNRIQPKHNLQNLQEVWNSTKVQTTPNKIYIMLVEFHSLALPCPKDLCWFLKMKGESVTVKPCK